MISAAKSPTTPDITSGVTAAIRALDPPVDQVSAVMIGTTHFLNALIEGRPARTRRGGPARLPATALPPMTDWP
ncbi:hydantoinase/oxoprolinase N-terminal domain-containing protein [Streptomyces sp. KL116D]|uniref:hydantoinase/oxoprolinase N-terminal domain-containing protein n=1 Tax=Streptomyces sp. KL116D TaxID=3045152 RepID=UPI003557C5C6